MNARDTKIKLVINEYDCTKSCEPYLTSLTYTDSDEDDSDDLQIELQDRDGNWRKSWLSDVLKKAYVKTGNYTHLKLEPVIIRENWNGDGKNAVLDCGLFELDTVTMAGPPSVITLKGTALSSSSAIASTKRTQAWEKYNLKSIAKQIASRNNCKLMYLSTTKPKFSRIEQSGETDIAFLKRICKASGISLKCTNGLLVLFNKQDYQAKKSVGTITYGDGKYISYSCTTGDPKEKYTHVCVSCTKSDGTLIKATYEVPSDSGSSSSSSSSDDDKRVLYRTHQCDSTAEALNYAKYLANRYNKFSKSISFNLPGNPYYLAGLNITVKGFGTFSGKYTINKATHKVSSSGYTTDIEMTEVV